MKDNLEKGYGVFYKTSQQDLTGGGVGVPSKNKVIEALKESGNLTEDTFPKTPAEKPRTNNEKLKESGNLTEDTFPKTHTEKPRTNIEKLKESGALTEDTFPKTPADKPRTEAEKLKET